MARRVMPLGDEVGSSPERFGGKAAKLAAMEASGVRVPPGLAVPTEVYDEYVDSTGLRGRILIELARKDLAGMRYEELWDIAQDIRAMFVATPVPEDLREELGRALEEHVADRPVAVRSSALGEDSATASFAGIHESYVNVRGKEAVLDHVRLVWASLWSESALMYKKELDLDVRDSAMAVLVQELVEGDRSGIAFTESPVDPAAGVIEAVHGLNQGLVDGLVEPDRWTVRREDGTVMAHSPAERLRAMRSAPGGVALEPLTEDLSSVPPLGDGEVPRVWDLAMGAEGLFGSPQDVEWTISEAGLFALQSRPITTVEPKREEDKRAWYMTLKRSFESLEELRRELEEEVFPRMLGVAEELEGRDLSSLSDAELADEHDLTSLSDAELADEIEGRDRTFHHWVDVYWDDFIPLAHGARLFGDLYNQRLSPEDPHEFVDLLVGQDLLSTRRNSGLKGLASRLAGDASARDALEAGDWEALEAALGGDLDALLRELGGSFGGGREARAGMLRLVREMALHGAQDAEPSTRDAGELEARYLAAFDDEELDMARRMLDLGRASYRLRDDDNIFLGRIEAQLVNAVDHAIERLENRLGERPEGLDNEEVAFALREPGWRPGTDAFGPLPDIPRRFGARQLVGQASAGGVARGRARVILDERDLFEFRAGEVLVTDAIDPNMTFVVPLASAVVERRGGMLIHGAIIAREYGLPCVTAVTNATEYIHTGDEITVDGYLGIVSVQRRAGDAE
jgi:pyruvate,water dikinase